MSEGYLGLFVAAAVAQLVATAIAAYECWRRWFRVTVKPRRDDRQV